MGLFGSRTKTQVGTQIQRAITDDALPNGVRSGASKAIFGDDGQLTEHMLEDLVGGIGVRASRLLAYGKDGYTWGLPQSTLHSSFAGQDASRAAIAATEGPVTLSYYHFGPLNNLHYGWSQLVSAYGYVASSNELTVLSAAKGSKVYLSDMVAVVAEASQQEIDSGALDVWAPTPRAGYTPQQKLPGLDVIGALIGATPYQVDPAASDHLLVTYCWEVQTVAVVSGINVTRTTVQSETLTIPLTGLDLEASYHQARFVRSDGSVGYWSYAPGTGTHPDVDAVFAQSYAEGGQFFPWAYFRFDKTKEASGTPAYASTKKLLKTLSMDYDALVDGIDQNPDIADVEQAFLMMAVPASTNSPVEQRYLFDFFSGIYNDSASTPALNNRFTSPKMAELTERFTDVAQGSVIIQDRRFKMALAYDSIVWRRVAATVGPIGSHSSGVDGRVHWYRRQLSETVCEEVAVTGLKMTYWVWGDYTTVGDETNEAILMVPLDASLTQHYPIPVRELLYARSLHYVFNSRVVTKLKWYQTGIFQVVLIAITLAIAWASYGASLTAFATALVAGTVTMEMVIAGLTVIIKQIATSLAIKLFVHETGAKLAFLAALAAAMAGGYGMFSAESAASAPLWAKNMLALSTGLSQGVQTELKSEFNDLLADVRTFESEVQQQQAKLQQAENELNGGKLDPFIIFGETPSDFYQRTVHSGNIGALSMDAVTSFVDVALTLPKPIQTLGDSYA